MAVATPDGSTTFVAPFTPAPLATPTTSGMITPLGCPRWFTKAVIGKSSPVSSLRRRFDLPHRVTWLFRVLWAVLPVTAGPLFETCLVQASRPVQIVAALGLWITWAIVLAASLIPTMITLTLLRIIASTRHDSAIAAIAGLTTTAIAALTAFTAEVGEVFVQAAAYGDERRFPLRAPGPIVITILPLGWLLAAGTTIVGPLLLAARQWIAGAIVTVVAVGWGTVFARRAHRLARRFAVFVPAGFVLHDHVVLADTAMFAAATVSGLGLAPAGSETQSTDKPAASNTRQAAVETSGPIPSPGINTIVCFAMINQIYD